MSFLVRLAFLAVLLVLVSPGAGFAHPSQKTTPGALNSPTADNKVDINSSGVEQLMKVPGMTRTWAARIIRFRPYRAKNDLLDRGVLPSPVYDRIKDYVIAHRTKQ